MNYKYKDGTSFINGTTKVKVPNGQNVSVVDLSVAANTGWIESYFESSGQFNWNDLRNSTGNAVRAKSSFLGSLYRTGTHDFRAPISADEVFIEFSLSSYFSQQGALDPSRITNVNLHLTNVSTTGNYADYTRNVRVLDYDYGANLTSAVWLTPAMIEASEVITTFEHPVTGVSSTTVKVPLPVELINRDTLRMVLVHEILLENTYPNLGIVRLTASSMQNNIRLELTAGDTGFVASTIGVI